jgi:hypothetical protein
LPGPASTATAAPVTSATGASPTNGRARAHRLRL